MRPLLAIFRSVDRIGGFPGRQSARRRGVARASGAWPFSGEAAPGRRPRRAWRLSRRPGGEGRCSCELRPGPRTFDARRPVPRPGAEVEPRRLVQPVRPEYRARTCGPARVYRRCGGAARSGGCRRAVRNLRQRVSGRSSAARWATRLTGSFTGRSSTISIYTCLAGIFSFSIWRTPRSTSGSRFW